MSSDKSVDGGCDAFNTFFLETGADKQFHRIVELEQPQSFEHIVEVEAEEGCEISPSPLTTVVSVVVIAQSTIMMARILSSTELAP